MTATSFVKTALGVGALGLAALATPALAQDAPDGPGSTVSVAVTAGTLGIGPDVGFRISNAIGIRGNATFLSLNADTTVDDNDYSADLKLKSFGAMVDVYPFGGAFRISGGARINRNRAGLSGDFTNQGSVEIDDTTYTGSQVGVLSGRARVKKFAPALTLGWGGSNKRGFFFSFEAGVLFQGSVRLQEFQATGSLRDNATFRQRLEGERQNIQDDINDYKLYPILQSGIGWRF